MLSFTVIITGILTITIFYVNKNSSLELRMIYGADDGNRTHVVSLEG